MLPTSSAFIHSTLILAFLLVLRYYATQEENMPGVIAVDFEVFGKVQGVYFRKFTASKANELGLSGWCMNSKGGTVLGYIEGTQNKIDEMKNWLRYTGSPTSSIEKTEFRNEKMLDSSSIDGFTIKK